jgi:hypothetical protein
MAKEVRLTIRFEADEAESLRRLALGDETLSQTIRRVLREAVEASERQRKGKKR